MNVLLDPFGTSVQTKPNSVTEFPEADNLDATKPSMFQGIGEALSDIPGYAAYSSLSSLNSAIAVRTDSLYDMENQEDPFAEDFAFKRPDKETAVKAIEDQAKHYRLKAKNEYMPSAETTGTASMMIHGMGSMILQAVTHTMLTGNPYLGAASFGMDRGFFTRGDLMDKGVDEKTANKAGLAAGVFEGAGMALPGALGSKVLKSMAFGAVVNPATDIGENATIGFILNNADYQKQAREYDPFDPTNLAVSAGMGAFFGALGARTNRRATAILNAEEERTAAPNAGEEGQAAPNTNMNKSVLDSIQNRDRSSKESRLQMEKIAAAPNFNLLRESRSLDQGAPIIAYVPEDMNILWGKRVDVSADPSSEPMTMRYAVVDADDVLTSNAVDGSSNPGFTDPTVAGARAIAGNGRIAGLQGAYRQVKATKYRADLTQDSKEFGISKRQIKKMRNPILVRVMDDADVVEGIGEASNRTGTLKLNPAEQAAQDARNVRLEEVEFTKDGEITRKSMDEFVKRTPDKEGLIDSNGNALYDNIARRMRPAIFAAAFSDTRIINRFIADSPEDRKIMNVLQSVATEVVRLKKIKGELDFSPDLLEAVADVFETRREAKKINGKGHEKELTGSLMEESATPAQRYFRDILLSANPERLQEILARFREVAEQESGGAGFFEVVTKDQVFQTVKKEFDSFDRAVNQIKPSHVDAAMELQSARIIQEDQPSGTRGDINKSIADEKKAAEQIDNGEKVEVSGEGVDPEVMDKNVSDFITRFVKELVGAGAEQKVAEMGAKVHDAFFETLGIRLGRSRKELEQEYGVKVQRAESAEGFAQEPLVREGMIRKPDSDSAKVVTIPENVIPKFERRIENIRNWVLSQFKENSSAVIASTNQHIRIGKRGLNASLKRVREPHHNEVYPYLINVLENAEYDRFEINDGKEKHKGLAGQDVYVSALRIGDRLYSVKIKVDIPGKGEIEQRKTTNGVIEDGRYKDHKVSEIDITPAINTKEASVSSIISRPDASIDGGIPSINRISLGILRGNVNPTKIDNGVLRQNGNAPRGIYTPGERVITLMQSANESTFIHESGHYFLDVLTDVAMKENAPAQVKADVQTLMDWFGVKDLEEWRSLSIDEQRAGHEQFARGFEQYLREGEAPSTALEKVFKAFKDWLTKIYKSSEELQVEISPEVRAVYDRLLATDEQIRAKEEIDTPSLFGGMEPEEPPANPVVKAVQQTAEQVIDQAPISEDSKARIRETLGINQPEPQTGENHPHYGIPNEEQFMDQNLETSAANDPNAFIVLDDGREVSMGDYMREIEAEQKQEFDRANSVSEAAQCMLRNGAFDDVF